MLLKIRVSKNDKTYCDLLECWKHNNKVYFVRVVPRFEQDYKLLCSQAIWCEGYDNIEKYL